MARERVPGINVLNDLELKVNSEIRAIELKQPHGLSTDQRLTLRRILFVSVGRELLKDYDKKGLNVSGRGYINALFLAEEAELGARRTQIDSGYSPIAQIQSSKMTDDMNRSGAYLGGSVRDNTAISTEDFHSGLIDVIASEGSKFSNSNEDRHEDFDEQERNPFRFRADQTRFGRHVTGALTREYNPKGRNVEEVLNTLPRKYVIKDQTYLLNVEETLKSGNIDRGYPGYHLILQDLNKERDDPVKRDALMLKYSQIELEVTPIKEVTKEIDD